MDKQILPVGNILVRKEIAEKPFKCDLLKCKGACCTFESHYGAPVTWDEVDKINGILPTVIDYIPKVHKDVISEEGFYDIKKMNLCLKVINIKPVFLFIMKMK